MVALLVIATILVFLTIDLWVQHSALRTVPGVPMILPAAIPAGALLDAAHNWVRAEPGGGLTVGADGLAAALLGNPALTSWLPVGAHVRKGDPMVTLRQNQRSVDLPAPLTGRVLARNELLRRDPAAARGDPFGEGWFYRIDPEGGPAPRGREGRDASGWLRVELRRLRETLGGLARIDAATVPTLADGGAPAAGLAAELEEKAWQTLSGAFFSYTPERAGGPTPAVDDEPAGRTS